MPDALLNMIVVDDNPVLVSVLAEIFRECGHDVRVASDGFVALAEMRRGYRMCFSPTFQCPACLAMNFSP